MRLFFHILFLCALTSLVGSCDKTDVYEEKSKTLDSLSGAVNSMANELLKVDTIVLKKSVARYTWYKQFIQQNITDTITKTEADNLQHFYASGQNLENFSENRKQILLRATLVNSQVLKLTEDIKSKKPNKEQVIKFTGHEKLEAAKLIEAGYLQQKLYHTGLEEFSTSLKGVELLIRSRNNGELPIIIKDSINL